MFGLLGTSGTNNDHKINFLFEFRAIVSWRLDCDRLGNELPHKSENLKMAPFALKRFRFRFPRENVSKKKERLQSGDIIMCSVLNYLPLVNYY